MAFIDLSHVSWSDAVMPVFAGTFNGNGFTVRGLTIRGTDNAGLFGEIAAEAEVYNLGVVDVNVTGADCTSGLVCKNRGNVSNCYSTGTVSGDNYVGGLVGINYGHLSNCYSTSAVIGDDFVGGLVGSGNISEAVNCFWDVITSGITRSAGGVGLITAQMKDINTYLDAGWDFMNETRNGTEDIWWMPEGEYPRLFREFTE